MSDAPDPSSAAEALATAPIQIVFDCSDPHAQADFWAGALGYEVEQNEDFIQQMLDGGQATDGDVARHRGVLVWKDAAAMRDPSGRRPRWYLQRVAEPKAVKNRVHPDFHVGPGLVESVVEHLQCLGASKLYDGRQGPQAWVTMADPEGNEFCIS